MIGDKYGAQTNRARGGAERVNSKDNSSRNTSSEKGIFNKKKPVDEDMKFMMRAGQLMSEEGMSLEDAMNQAEFEAAAADKQAQDIAKDGLKSAHELRSE